MSAAVTKEVPAASEALVRQLLALHEELSGVRWLKKNVRPVVSLVCVRNSIWMHPAQTFAASARDTAAQVVSSK